MPKKVHFNLFTIIKKSLEINEVLSPIEANSYSYTTGMIIKVPYETFISLNAFSQNSMILMCDGLENMQEVINNIQIILPDCESGITKYN